MILGIGTDAVRLERTLKLNEHALEKIFSASELKDYSLLKDASDKVKASFLASRFAVKEAYSKARGTGFCDYVVPSEITTKTLKSGQPVVVLEGKTLAHAGSERIHVSITHEDPLAIAFVVLEGEENGKK